MPAKKGKHDAADARFSDHKPWMVRAIQNETRQALQGNEDATTPKTKLRTVLAAMKHSVNHLLVDVNVVSVLTQTTTEGNIQQRMQKVLDDIDKVPNIIGEGAGSIWINGVDTLSDLVKILFELQSKEKVSAVTADHCDKVLGDMKKLVSQVRLVESHLMGTYALRVDQYTGAFATAEKLLGTMNGMMEVLRQDILVLQNASLAKTLVEFFCDVPKMQLFESFENLNRNLAKELLKADKYANDIIGIFKIADVDRNGSISKEELSKMLCRLGDWTPEQLDGLFMKVDVDHDGNVQYGEFVRWISSNDSVLEDAAEHYAMTMVVFKKYDKDCSGYINATELQTFLEEHQGHKMKMPKVKQFMSELDTNGDHRLDCIEFIQYLNFTDQNDE
jgi:Ca2+-binding EF-hand superfamily protein